MRCHSITPVPPRYQIDGIFQITIPDRVGVSRKAAGQRVQNVLTVLGKARGIPFDHPFHPRPAAVIGPRLGDAVELRDGRSERWHQFETETFRRGQTAEQCLLREAIHLADPIDGNT